MRSVIGHWSLVILLCGRVLATTLQSGPTPEVLPEQSPAFRTVGWIEIENRTDGAISVFRPGEAPQVIGHVLIPCEHVNPRGYTAAKWARSGSVAATAVNAIHIKTAHNWAEDRGVIFSLVPADLMTIPGDYRSYRNPEASLFTDIPAGRGIFGGRYSPLVGDPVFVRGGDGDGSTELAEVPPPQAGEEGWRPLPDGYVPRIGDALRIEVRVPDPCPLDIVFENRFGGRIVIEYAEHPPRIIGEVLRPVLGIGRFEGTPFAAPGRIRANHCGVIDVSTSPLGELGGFQIIPANHAQSPEMGYARRYTQWMVVGPVSVLEPSWEGIAPLFSAYIRPVYTPLTDGAGEPSAAGLAGLLERFLVDCRMDNGEWRPLPVLSVPREYLPDEAFTELAHVTHIRILFPVPEPGQDAF